MNSSNKLQLSNSDCNVETEPEFIEIKNFIIEINVMGCELLELPKYKTIKNKDYHKNIEHKKILVNIVNRLWKYSNNEDVSITKYKFTLLFNLLSFKNLYVLYYLIGGGNAILPEWLSNKISKKRMLIIKENIVSGASKHLALSNHGFYDNHICNMDGSKVDYNDYYQDGLNRRVNFK